MEMKYEIYSSDDLGFTYNDEFTSFRVWAPQADKVSLKLYRAGNDCDAYKIIPMNRAESGTWLIQENGDLKNIYYTYVIEDEYGVRETQDPYGKAAGVNGVRTMVVDLTETNPADFEMDKGPRFQSRTDIVVTEISILDTTGDLSCGACYPGKYLGLTETGLKFGKYKTGIDHLADMGVTHVQLMPSYDFGSIDEASESEQYNWGYDPVNYNIPEGAFSTDPYNGAVRIREYKEMVKAIHDKGLGIIMDVVYNHTYNIEDCCLQKTVPDYFYRKDGDSYSNASACGNEIASERPMVRKYIIDSLCYWAEEYHIDGFRFDLMGVLDIETMNQAYDALVKINPDIILYGEGWTGGASTLPEHLRAMKTNVKSMPGVGVFSDDIRDSIKGHVFDFKAPGFVNGGAGFEERIKACVLGSVSDIPGDAVNYVSCHDNLTLWDKLQITAPFATEEERLAMNRLAASIVFTSQGIPFFLQGEEFARSKPYKGEFAENSYNLPMEVNSLKYNNLEKYSELVDYYKGLIKFRRQHKGLRLEMADIPSKHIRFMENESKNLVSFVVDAYEESLFIAYNANPEAEIIPLPEGNWSIYILDNIAGDNVIGKIKNQTEIPGISCLAAVKSSV